MSRNALVVGACVLAIAISVAGRFLQDQNQQILDELRQIRQLLERTAPPANVKLANVTGPFLGSADAPLTMVEFTDLQCPFCRQFHITTFEQIKRDYIDTGKLRYLSRDFPLDSIHPLAIAAARAARCAAAEGRFWDMRHTILVNNVNLRPDSFVTFAEDLKLDVGRFKSCAADTGGIDAEWQQDRTDGTSVGISGTPTFVIGRSSGDELDGVRIAGAQPYSVFDAKFTELLAPGTSPP